MTLTRATFKSCNLARSSRAALQLSRAAVLFLLAVSQERVCFAAPKAQLSGIAKFIQEKEAAIEEAQAELLSGIEEAKAETEKLKLGEKAKQKRLVQIEADLKRFRKDSQLPTSIELLEVTVKALEARNRILSSIQLKQDLLLGEPETSADKKDRQKLAELKTKVEYSLGGKFEVKKGMWNGTCVVNTTGPVYMKMVIDAVTAQQFIGSLRQKKDTAEFFGKVEGRKVIIETRSAGLGQNSSIVMSGYMVKDRFVGRVTGATNEGKAVDGWFEFKRDKDKSR